MKCLHPFVKVLKDRPKIVGYRNQEYYQSVEVPCGKCLACRINKRREWTTRLLAESEYSSTSFFFTLTYREDALPKDSNGVPCVCKRDVQLFLKRLRKHYGPGIRYFINSEYSPDKLRPHYHGIIFNLPQSIVEDSKTIKRLDCGRWSTSYFNQTICDIWSLGDVEFSEAIKERCGYCAKYFVDRKQLPYDLIPNFTLVSKGSSKNHLGGIGYRYALDIGENVRFYKSRSMRSLNTNNFQALPRYFYNKIYDENTRKEFTEQFIQDNILEINDISSPLKARILEYQLYRSMTFKNKKQKLK